MDSNNNVLNKSGIEYFAIAKDVSGFTDNNININKINIVSINWNCIEPIINAFGAYGIFELSLITSLISNSSTGTII